MNLVVREILVKELSKKIRMLTEHEDTAVMASYSLAQVHAAMADAASTRCQQLISILNWLVTYVTKLARNLCHKTGS
jgi:predicted unusual protein kinase regulating ubiquinone biosynthesis (AarF/ABC1/UbiB family)